jgi:hypothetical protein
LQDEVAQLRAEVQTLRATLDVANDQQLNGSTPARER